MEDKKIGQAYAFFDCDASLAQIGKAMPDIRHKARTDEGLELLLHEGNSGLQFDPVLAENLQCPEDYRIMSSELFRQPQGHEEEKRPLGSLKYTLLANYRGVSNEDTANELGHLMIFIHGMLDQNQDLYRCGVIYEKDGEYNLLG